MRHLIVYTADLHGNETQYQKLIKYAIDKSANSIIIGGDIAPKEDSQNYMENQRKFIQNELPKLILPLKQQLPNSNLFLLMGNDDCWANLEELEQNDPKLYRIIHNKRIKITEDFEIIGYSYVPITPFALKDWEKFDLTEIPESLRREHERRKNNCRFDGYKTDSEGWQKFQFSPQMERLDSIQKDLNKELFKRNSDRTIYIIHSPPNRTNLDQMFGGHVGSFAVREFIEKEQPYITLHGHIHETVKISGKFKDQIGKTICLSSGNHNVSQNLALLVFDLYNPEEVKRLII